MKSIISAVVAMMATVSMAFNVATTTSTCDVQKVTGNWDSFNARWIGVNTECMKLYLTDGGVPLNLTTNGVSAKICRRNSAVTGTNVTGLTTYNLLSTLDGSISVSGNLVTFTLSYTNIAPDGRCMIEVWAWAGTSTNVTRTLAQGQVTISGSLYEPGDSLFPWPASVSVFADPTNLINYVNVTNASFLTIGGKVDSTDATYLQITNKVPFSDATYLQITNKVPFSDSAYMSIPSKVATNDASYLTIGSKVATNDSVYLSVTNKVPYNDATYLQITNKMPLMTNTFTFIGAGFTNTMTVTATNFQFHVGTNTYYLP